MGKPARLLLARQGMSLSKLEQISLATTLAMVAGLKQYALDRYAASYSDAQVSEILASHDGSMIQALAHLDALAMQVNAKAA